MKYMYMGSFFCLGLVLILLLVCFMISFSSMLDREKASPFECGFDPSDSARVPFSLRFFLLAVIFLIFDIEIVLLMPFPVVDTTSNGAEYLVSAMIFLFVLVAGLFYEWKEGSLEWSD